MNSPINYPAWLEEAYRTCRATVPGAARLETILVQDAWMRVTAAEVVAQADVPPVPLAACDGYALHAADTAHASREAPIELALSLSFPGLVSADISPAARALEAGGARAIPALTPLPARADAVASSARHVVSIENGPPRMVFERPLHAGEDVIAAGSDYRRGQVLLVAGERITAGRQARLIAAGVREVVVARRLRIGVVVSSYEYRSSVDDPDLWRRPDLAGPYVHATLRQLGYEPYPIEYLVPPDMSLPPPALRQAQEVFTRQLEALAERYDLIIGLGLPDDKDHMRFGMNAQRSFSGHGGRVTIRQVPGANLGTGNSRERSPAIKRRVDVYRADGTLGGAQTLTVLDQATLINLPGQIGSVAVLMRAIVPHLLDRLEHVARPGPHWHTALLASAARREPASNTMRWGRLRRDGLGVCRVELLAEQAEALLGSFSQADALVAIPAGDAPLAAGSSVYVLPLDRSAYDAPDATAQPLAEMPEVRAAASGMAVDEVGVPVTLDDVETSWAKLDARLAGLATDASPGLNGPASAERIAALQAALGLALPADLLVSLRIHDGQSAAGLPLVGEDRLLGNADILAQWSLWRGLVTAGDFEGVESEPDRGIKTDWYNLRWIPFTHDGSGNHLCVDLDPAEHGRPGQVIRVWHDDARRELIADSYARWLADVAGMSRG